MTNTQTKSAYDQITEQAFPGSAGYQLEESSRPGAVRTLPENSQKPYWSINPFEPPSEVAEGWHRIKYVDVNGKLLYPNDPRTPVPTVYIDFGLQRPAPGQPAPAPAAPLSPGESDRQPSQREPLREDLHPAAESEESMERELFSQHIERNEYSNFKLRSETRAIESLYAVIQRMTAEQHVLFQSTLETPRRVANECKQLVETMGEAMRSFHSMIELQSASMQSIQKQMELSRVPPPPPPPPDYVGLGKTLLEILRDLGMKAMDSGYVRRPLPARRNQELPEIRDAEFSQPVQKAQPTQADQQASTEEDDSQEAQQAAPEDDAEQGAEELRRLLNRLGKVDVSRVFSSPENLRDLLADIRKEIDESRKPSAEELAPAQPSVTAPAVAIEKAPEISESSSPVPSNKTVPAASAPVPPPSTKALVPSSKTPPPSAKSPPLASAKTSPQPASSQTAMVPSGQTPRSSSGQTPLHLKHEEPRRDHASMNGKRRP